MGELNPQVTNQLRALEVSPKLVPHLTCFAAGFDRSRKAEIVAAITAASTTPAGRQLMTIFQCDRVEERPLSILQTTQELMAEYARLHPEGGTSQSVANPPLAASLGGTIK